MLSVIVGWSGVVGVHTLFQRLLHVDTMGKLCI